MNGPRATTRSLTAAAAVLVLATLVCLVLLSHARQARAGITPARATGTPLPLSPGQAWYSKSVDTSAPTVANGERKPTTIVLQKWITRQGDEFLRQSLDGKRLGPGDYVVGDAPPGFGDWDALDVHTLPATEAGIMRMLRGRTLQNGGITRRESAAERRSPLIWLAQLAAMLADDPNTPQARDAAFAAIASFPQLEQLGQVTDPLGRSGVAVAERAYNLHPLSVATGPGCTDPLGGNGCDSVAEPSGSYELELIFDPDTHAVLAVRTVALSDIPAAKIMAGTAIYEISYLAGTVVSHPPIPPVPRPGRPSIQSVPWQLARVDGRRITVHWESGTCDPELKPRPRIRSVATATTITISVEVHVNRGGTGLCAGVGLRGTLSTTLAQPVGDRRIRHGRVTDHDR